MAGLDYDVELMPLIPTENLWPFILGVRTPS